MRSAGRSGPRWHEFAFTKVDEKKVLERSYVEKRGGQLFHPTQVGRTLLRGYVDIGFDLGKPEQRAEMERTINRVASGLVQQ